MVTPRNRVLSAIDLEESDRVPISEYVNAPIASKMLGREAYVGIGGGFRKKCFEMLKRGKRDELMDRISRDHVDLYMKLELDIALALPLFGKNYIAPEQVAKNEWILNVAGFWTKYKLTPETDMLSEVDSSIRRGGVEELEKYVKLVEQIDFSVDVGQIEMVEYAAKTVGDSLLVVGIADGTFPVGESWIPVFLQCLYVRPDLARRLIKKSTEMNIEIGKAMIDAGAEAIIGTADWAYQHGPFFSPKQFREFILPSLKEHINAFHNKGVPYIKHTDGNVEPIEEDFLKSGIDGYHSIEPRAGMDIGKIKEKYGNRICLFGNVDCAHTLVYGDTEDVAKETKQCIKSASPGGGHVLSSSNSIHSSVKIENFLTMLKTARKYGKYRP